MPKKKSTVKVTSKQIKEYICQEVKKHLKESHTNKRMMHLERIKLEAGITTYDLLEDILEQLDEASWNVVYKNLRKKYSYR